MVGLETPRSRLASPTVAAPLLSRSTISRRIGWASAAKASLAIMLTIFPHTTEDGGGDPMPEHAVGTQERWLSARKELLAAEKEHMRQGDELARRRRELPWVPVTKEYSFETGDGTKSLAELFDGRSQLLVYHFMFGFGYRVDDENPGCTGCSFVADHFDGVLPHLNAHDVTLVSESIAPLAELNAYRERMGWT